jgi:hypothetical protein
MGRKDVVVPNKPSYKTKQLGSRHSPEWMFTAIQNASWIIY